MLKKIKKKYKNMPLLIIIFILLILIVAGAGFGCKYWWQKNYEIVEICDFSWKKNLVEFSFKYPVFKEWEVVAIEESDLKTLVFLSYSEEIDFSFPPRIEIKIEKGMRFKLSRDLPANPNGVVYNLNLPEGLIFFIFNDYVITIKTIDHPELGFPAKNFLDEVIESFRVNEISYPEEIEKIRGEICEEKDGREIYVLREKTGKIGGYFVRLPIGDAPISYFDANGKSLISFYIFDKEEEKNKASKIIDGLKKQFPIEEKIDCSGLE